MSATFRVTFGEIKCDHDGKSKIIDKRCLAKFWHEISSGNRHGVYVFGIRAGKGWKPLYVGQAKRQTFRKRISQHTRAGGDFDKMLNGIKRGTPVLFLIGRVGKGRNCNKAIDELEIEFINYAFARNKDLYNDRGIRRPRYIIQGFGGPGKPSKHVAGLKKMIGY